MSIALRVLIVNETYEDYIFTTQLLSRIPTYEFHTEWCQDSCHALDSMLEGLVDAYVINYNLNGKTGTDLFVEALIDQCREPVVLVTGHHHHAYVRTIEGLKVSSLTRSELSTAKLEAWLNEVMADRHDSRRSA